MLSMSAMAQNTRKESESLIRASRTSSNEAIAKQDVDGIAVYWLPDFVQVRGNGSHLVGKDTITSLWKKSFKENPKVSYARNPSEIIISSNDSLACENGIWVGINSYSKGGKYSAMWRKRKGVWKLQAELFVALE
jgi:ketosteroid isomerase-like protein